jgi:hypothetical protein
MGVTVSQQEEKGKGKPWWVFIVHDGKRKSIRSGMARAALAGGASKFSLPQN